MLFDTNIDDFYGNDSIDYIVVSDTEENLINIGVFLDDMNTPDFQNSNSLMIKSD